MGASPDSYLPARLYDSAAMDTPVIDAQVHAYERDRPERPWIGYLHGPPEVTGDQMVAAMDEVGVDGAILVSPYSMYRYDASYALEGPRRPPGQIRPGQAVRPRRRGCRGAGGPVGAHRRRRGRADHAAGPVRGAAPTIRGSTESWPPVPRRD